MRRLLIALSWLHALIGVYLSYQTISAAYRAWSTRGEPHAAALGAVAVFLAVFACVFIYGASKYLRTGDRPAAVDIAFLTVVVIWALGGWPVGELAKLIPFTVLGPLGRLIPIVAWTCGCYLFFKRLLEPAAIRATTESPPADADLSQTR